MMMQLEHIALSVMNIGRSLSFYRDLIGMRVVMDMETEPGGQLEHVNGLKDCVARIVHLKSDEFMLELFEYHQPAGRPLPADHIQADKGFIHIGFKSHDIHADYTRLSEKGVQFVSRPIEFRPGVWVVYFRGPDGETCELRQT